MVRPGGAKRAVAQPLQQPGQQSRQGGFNQGLKGSPPKKARDFNSAYTDLATKYVSSGDSQLVSDLDKKALKSLAKQGSPSKPSYEKLYSYATEQHKKRENLKKALE